jgi:ribosomal protein S18 acetylase RimI-like enzyme
MADPIGVDRPTEAEVKHLYVLAKSTFGGLPGWSDERVLATLEEDLVFVARERSQPAGYVALRPDPEPALVIEQLFVAPGHEHHGVGHRLLAFSEGYAIANRMNALRVVAERGNWRARDFYRRSGFVPVADEVLELVLPRAG